MHEAALAHAARPAPAVVLGLSLKPYSLGHELCLIRENNPLHEKDTATPAQLAEAVWICSCGWDELGVSWGNLLKVGLWKMRLKFGKRISFASELSRFVAYQQDGSGSLPISDTLDSSLEQSPRTPGAPFLLRLQQFLMVEFGLSESEAWDYPMGLANMRWCTFWEQKAGLKIYNSDDAKHDAYVMEMEAKGKEQLANG